MRRLLQLQITCQELPVFDASELDSVRTAFQNSKACALRQTWLPRLEADFTPATVRTGWRKNSLLLFAELIDTDIFTHATDHHQRFWELGDTFEIFLRPVEQESYAEFQITPNNLRLHLHFANATAVKHAHKTGSLENVLVRQTKFDSKTWIQPETGRWFVFAEILASSIEKTSKELCGSKWLFSFSRYDYIRGRNESVISSTSTHMEPDFHRQAEWGQLVFANRLPGLT
jgi:hypothetical protein